MVLLPAVVVGNLPNYLVYVAAFGIGSMLSMGVFCAGASGGLSALRARSRSAGRVLATATGSLSLAVGMVWLGVAIAA